MKLMTEDSEKLQAAFASLSDSKQTESPCPDPSRLWLAVRGELTAGQRRELVEHTVGCGPCAEAWRLAREMSAELTPPEGRIVPIRKRAAPRWISPVLAAAAAIGAVASIALWRDTSSSKQNPPVVYRGGESQEISSKVGPAERLSRRHCVLSWSGGPPGSRYTLQVSTEDSRILHLANELTRAEHLVPAAALQGLSAGDKILWQVEAFGRDGKQVLSPTFVTHIE